MMAGTTRTFNKAGKSRTLPYFGTLLRGIAINRYERVSGQIALLF
ncbi:hypothetical protein QT327_25960 [Olivibacter sp. 47]|nr:hypothetical protein [Olivibacter sp. 47]MDM8177754.1 hypothetical protein [Olivibacter sp. 47]